jgi:uncharacterized FlgJ-related protein
MKPRVPPKLKKFPEAKQVRMDELLERNRERRISSAEKAQLKDLVAEAEQLMVENAKRLAAFQKHEQTKVPSGAIPVTVWLKPASLGR